MMTTLWEENVVFEFYSNAFHLKDMVVLRMYVVYFCCHQLQPCMACFGCGFSYTPYYLVHVLNDCITGSFLQR